MELRHLRYFLAVAEGLNFSRAAEKLHVAQPALSRQIHDLEEELGFRLFARSTSQVHLTAEGEFFQQHVQKILLQLDLAVTGAQQVAKGISAEFRIGSDWNASALPITAAAAALRERLPRLAVDFVEIPGHEHVNALRAKKIDVGFVSGLTTPARGDVESAVLHTSAFKAIVPAGHPLAGRDAVRLRDLRHERWLVIAEEEIPGFKILMTQIFRPAQFVPKFGRTARSLAGVLAFVGTGEGISLIPELFLPVEPDGVRYVATDCAPFEMLAVWSKTHSSPHVTRYLEILREKMGVAKLPPAPMNRTPLRSRASA